MELQPAAGLSALSDIVLAFGLAAAVFTDLREGKVFDRVTLPSMAAGVLLNTLFMGLVGSGISAAGMATSAGLALAMTLLLGRGLGGGDVKLLAAVGALRGPEFALWTCLFAALSGPFLCLVPLVRSRLLAQTLRNTAHNAVSRFVFGVPVEIAAGTKAGKQPFSLAIAAGCLLTLLLR